MTTPNLVRDVPGLEGYLRSMTALQKPERARELGNYLGDLWRTEQGNYAISPSWMTTKEANDICSLVLAHRENVRRQGQPVPIKKVAEIRGSRYNTGKLRFDLIDGLAQEGLAAVLTKGAEKYDAHNWRKGMPVMECIASLKRHLNRLERGEDVDAETGLQHIDHIQCNAMFLSNMLKTRPDMDDRPQSGMDLRHKQPLAGDTNQATTFGMAAQSVNSKSS